MENLTKNVLRCWILAVRDFEHIISSTHDRELKIKRSIILNRIKNVPLIDLNQYIPDYKNRVEVQHPPYSMIDVVRGYALIYGTHNLTSQTENITNYYSTLDLSKLTN